MITMIAMTLISVAAVAFLLTFLVALCKDSPTEKCLVVRVQKDDGVREWEMVSHYQFRPHDRSAVRQFGAM